jgi:hypothetical protein
VATGSGVVRLLVVEPTKEERYAHALALIAKLSKVRPTTKGES